MRTIVPSTTSPCLKLLMSRVLLGEQLLHRRGLGAGRPRGDGGQLVLGLDVGRGRRVGRLVLRGCGSFDGLVSGCGGSLSDSGDLGLRGLGDGVDLGCRGLRGLDDRHGLADRHGLGDSGDLGVWSVDRLGGHGVRRLGRLDGCRGFGGLGLVGRGGLIGRRAIHRRGDDRLGCGGGARLGAGLGGGGLVGHGNGRDGLLGRRGIAGGRRLRRRRGPALLLVGQGDPVSFMDSALESRTAAEPRPGPS